MAVYDNYTSDVVFDTQIAAIVTFTCTIVTGINLFGFLTSEKFRSHYQLIISLTLAYVLFAGGALSKSIDQLNRHWGYSRTPPTPWDCITVWTLLYHVGDLWTSMITLIMGVERFAAAYFPATYRLVCFPRTLSTIACSFLLATAFTGMSAVLEALHSETTPWCRKWEVASPVLEIANHAFNVISFTTSSVLNAFAYRRAKKLNFKRKHITKIKNYTVVSFCSMLLVSVPHAANFALEQAAAVPVLRYAWLLKPVNGALLFAVYLELNADLREHMLAILSCTCQGPAVPVVSTVASVSHIARRLSPHVRSSAPQIFCQGGTQ